MLRAKSDTKKDDFPEAVSYADLSGYCGRTGKKKREKLSEIGRIRTVCQTETSHLVIPEGDRSGYRRDQFIKEADLGV